MSELVCRQPELYYYSLPENVSFFCLALHIIIIANIKRFVWSFAVVDLLYSAKKSPCIGNQSCNTSFRMITSFLLSFALFIVEILCNTHRSHFALVCIIRQVITNKNASKLFDIILINVLYYSRIGNRKRFSVNLGELIAANSSFFI